MTIRSPSRAALRRSAHWALALGLVGAASVAATGASAEDGIGGFLSSIFGGTAPAPQAEPAPRYAPSPVSRSGSAPVQFRHAWSRPLVVRLHQARPRLVVAQAPAKPGKVSIYEDRTLRRGDAVMTADGVRVFAGSTSWPYAAEDFVALKQARNIDHDTSKVLAQLDRVPRS